MTETDRSRAGYPRPQNFHEDLQYEHCNYYSPCSQCGHNFMGLPHRIACKLCETVWALTDERDALLADKARLDWLEKANTLHNTVELLYVVDGYEVDVMTHDGATCERSSHGATLRAAVDNARTAEAPSDG